MFTVDQIVADFFPGLNASPHRLAIIKPLLKKILRERSFTEFSSNYNHLQSIEFIEQVFEHLHFSYAVTDHERERIPARGRAVIVANHPIGALDGLALLKLIYEIRSDVKIVANDLLLSITPLRNDLLPVPVLTGSTGKSHVQRIYQALAAEQVVIFFPSGEVSRLTMGGIKDPRWHYGFLKVAEKTKAPIIPIHISGRNAFGFYIASAIAKPLSTLMLPGQIFFQRNRKITLTIGSTIPYPSYRSLALPRNDKLALFRKHLYRIGKGKQPLLQTETAVARPERRGDLKKALEQGNMIGRTPDGKSIYLFNTTEATPVLREIGRLRELTFRAVGEGTGKRRDFDIFDRYYQHLILWDEDDLEVAGAYRFVDAEQTIRERGTDGLYTASLFHLPIEGCYFINRGLELGRSFVQQRYWGKRSLDYLWYGIGAYLRQNNALRYLFGPVSISNSMPQQAKELLISFYRTYFAPPRPISISRNPFRFTRPEEDVKHHFTGTDYRADFTRLKNLLGNLGTAVPPLYKQYTELCEPGGVVFLDFNIDPDFNNCVDGLVIVDITKIKKAKRNRYMEETILV